MPTLASPVCSPMRTRTSTESGHSCSASARWAAAEARIAAPALRKTTKNESPLVSISIPPASEKAARRSRLWVESTSP